MILTNSLHKGFTAVELLITLFIASIFLLAGYQLYTQVIRDGQEASNLSEVSNLTHERLQSTATTTAANNPNGCTSASVSGPTDSQATVSGIGAVTFTTTVSCPRGASASADLFLIKIKASYTQNGEARELEHATYTN